MTDPQNAPDFHPTSTCYKCGADVYQDGEVPGCWIDSTDGDGCDPGVHDGAPFTFLREMLGAREVIDLASDYEYFAIDVIQDAEVADEMIYRIRTETEVITNENDDHGIYIERYTVIRPDAWVSPILDAEGNLSEITDVDFTEHEGTF